MAPTSLVTRGEVAGLLAAEEERGQFEHVREKAAAQAGDSGQRQAGRGDREKERTGELGQQQQAHPQEQAAVEACGSARGTLAAEGIDEAPGDQRYGQADRRGDEHEQAGDGQEKLLAAQEGQVGAEC
ncbi:MAG: hypothetical protein IPH86_12270 [bacterium]|nr:hypothetical protein [bacterium]